MTTEISLARIQILASAGFFIAAVLIAGSLSTFFAGSQIILDSKNGTEIVDQNLHNTGKQLQKIAWPYWIYGTIAMGISVFGSLFWINRIGKKRENVQNEKNYTRNNLELLLTTDSKYIYKNSITFAGILAVMLLLTYFITVPFHNDSKISPFNIIEILLAVFLTLFIFHVDYSIRKRERESKNTRKKKANSMLRRVLSAQSQLLDDLKNRPDQGGRLSLTNTPITNKEFVKRAFPVNNEEIVRILAIFSDVVEEDLLQQLIEFATQSSFYFTPDKINLTTQGIDVLIKKITEIITLIPNNS